ncbi:class I SAM-dependent methyltransferase [candidate division KSB1 bacterium]|nr:class I SAM-dependent methyltransferase [candidate division KSB1 bacterium]
MNSLDQETSGYFNGLAATWDMNISGRETYIRQILTNTGLAIGHTVLDLGCGTGVLAAFIRELIVPTGLLLAVDFAINMASRAYRSFPYIRAVCADALHLPFQSGRIDRIIGFHVFPHFANQHQVLAECFRLLKPGGQLCIFHLKCSRQINAFHATLNEPVRQHQLPRPPQMRAMLEQHHFTVLQADEQPGMYCVRATK